MAELTPVKIRNAVVHGTPYSLVNTIAFAADVKSRLALFRWNTDPVFCIPTSESLQQFTRIINHFHVNSVVEIFAGAGLVASLFSRLISYHAYDNFAYGSRNMFHRVSRLDYRKALTTKLTSRSLLIAFLPDEPYLRLEHVIAAAVKCPLWLVVYDSDMHHARTWIRRYNLKYKRLTPTFVAPGDYWNQNTNSPTLKARRPACRSLLIYKSS